MTNTTARLARRITWASSKQSYLTARLLADRDLADDCLRAYAYFRWADDRIDISLPIGLPGLHLSSGRKGSSIACTGASAQETYPPKRPCWPT